MAFTSKKEAIKHGYNLRKNKEYRISHSQIVISSPQLLLDESLTLLAVFAHDPVSELGISIKAPIFHLSEKEMLHVTGLKSPSQYAAIAKYSPVQPTHHSSVVILDGLQDPGNVGTLLRTCYALSIDHVIMTKSCCDVTNDKVIRSSKNALFHLPISSLTHEEIIAYCSLHSLTVFGASAKGDSIHSTTLSKNWSLILGNEGHGISKEFQELAHLISIPIESNAESLNVAIAGGILIYALKDKTA